MPLVVVFNQRRAGRQPRAWHEPGVPLSVSQIQVRAGAAEVHPGLAVSGHDRAAADVRAGVRLAWWRPCPSSFALAGVTVVLVWAGVAELLRQGRLEIVLKAGWAELAAPGLVTLVGAVGICERVPPAEARPVLGRGHGQGAGYGAFDAIAVFPIVQLASAG